MTKLARRVARRVARRLPDLEIGEPDAIYLRRWYLLPRNTLLNLYLHEIVRDDDERALHDHPWVNISWVLGGGYYEWKFAWAPVRGELPLLTRCWHPPGSVVLRRAATAHRLALSRCGLRPVPALSLFLTGPRLRAWGFWCPRGRWVPWRTFAAGPRGERIGKGCAP